MFLDVQKANGNDELASFDGVGRISNMDQPETLTASSSEENLDQLRTYVEHLIQQGEVAAQNQAKLNSKVNALTHLINSAEESGQEEDDESSNDKAESGLDKRSPSYLRFGKRNGPAYLRFGRGQAYLRFGKRSPNAYLRFGKRNPAYLRFGRK